MLIVDQLYSHLTTLDEGKSPRINPLRREYTSWTALRDVLTRSFTTRSAFNWTRYLPPPVTIIAPTADEVTEQHLRSMLTGEKSQTWKLKPAGLSNVTSIPLNPYVLEQSDCTFGCEGHLCDAADGCAPDLICKNSVCQQNEESQPGQIGDRCNSKAVCQSHLHCSGGECQSCSPRQTIQPQEKRKGLPRQQRRTVQPNDPNGQCYTDALPTLFTLQTTPICLPPQHHSSPCESATHCFANEYCSWGSCTPCTSSDACLGSPCRSNNKCKTGYCNDYGKCDYAGLRRKSFGPGGARGSRNTRMGGVPKG
jgi:hypothetical protein